MAFYFILWEKKGECDENCGWKSNFKVKVNRHFFGVLLFGDQNEIYLVFIDSFLSWNANGFNGKIEKI